MRSLIITCTTSWWDKGFARCFGIALIVAGGCSDGDSSAIALRRRGSDLLKVEYKELEVPSSIFISDSVQTEYDRTLRSGSRLMVGQYTDHDFGILRAQSYTQLEPYNPNPAIASGATLASCKLVLGFDYYHYGSGGESTNKLTVYELDGQLNKNKYFSHSSIAIRPNAIGSEEYIVNAEAFNTKRRSIEASPTVLERQEIDSVTVDLDNTFASRLFDAAKAQGTSYFDFEAFSKEFPGIALFPDANDGKIVGFDMNHDASTLSKSRIILYYDEPDAQTGNVTRRSLEYGLYKVGDFLRGFTQLTADRSASPLRDVDRPYIEFTPTEWRYCQSGAALALLIDFSSFIELADGIENMVFNSVELSIDIEPDNQYPPPEALQLKILDKDNRLVHFSDDLKQKGIAFYSGIMSVDERGWLSVGYNQANSEATSATLRLVYDESKHSYKGDFTSLFQTIRYDKEKELRPKRFAVLAQLPWVGLSVNRFLFKQSNLKLKVYYTTPLNTQKS